jgi:uncharacterized protein
VVNLYRNPDAPDRLSIDRSFYERVADAAGARTLVERIVAPPRSGRAWPVLKGHICRIVTIEGPQVCDFNMWNLHNPRERFWASRTRQLEGAHVTVFNRLWSSLPYLRPMCTITGDTLSRMPTPNGGRCHDLLGSRCDPYMYMLTEGREHRYTCHSNLTRAIAPYHLTELDVHDVINIFQVTGLDPVHEIYFSEPCPARPGDYFEFFAEIDLLCALSVCQSGDCSISVRGRDPEQMLPTCRPLGIEVYRVTPDLLDRWRSPEPASVPAIY